MRACNPLKWPAKSNLGRFLGHNVIQRKRGRVKGVDASPGVSSPRGRCFSPAAHTRCETVSLRPPFPQGGLFYAIFEKSASAKPFCGVKT